ncbi:MAG: flagellar basal body L-ring protein FlgH [Planctomycetes bacterium]|nr:flagellar basal body L-ring protein FlgH [Planctomycetota bacterium]
MSRMHLVVLAHLLAAGLAAGQSSSLLLSPPRLRTTTAPADAQNAHAGSNHAAATDGGAVFLSTDPKDDVLPMTRAIERVSLYAIPAAPPRKFKVRDLITIIVRQQKKYEADAEMESKKKWNLTGKLSDWFRFYDDAKHLGSDKLSNGEPGFKFDFNNKYQTDAQNDREDKFTTRITAHVIDVKPNGNLVLEATMEEQHDEEVASITLTGICRSVDVTPDNTVLSTQVADLKIVEKNHGAVRDATTRGWVPRILNFAGGPF